MSKSRLYYRNTIRSLIPVSPPGAFARMLHDDCQGYWDEPVILWAISRSEKREKKTGRSARSTGATLDMVLPLITWDQAIIPANSLSQFFGVYNNDDDGKKEAAIAWSCYKRKDGEE